MVFIGIYVLEVNPVQKSYTKIIYGEIPPIDCV